MTKRNHTIRKLSQMAAAAALCVGQATAAAEPGALICGFANVEDLVALPDSPWIIGSGIGDQHFQKGGLHLFHRPTATGKAVVLDLPKGLTARAPYDQCPGPADPELFSAHGISLMASGAGTWNLYVVNHGGRESIEVFEVKRGNVEPTLRWIGCIVTPATAMTNSVAARTDGSLVLSASAAADVPLPAFHAMGHEEVQKAMTSGALDRALARGAVFTWARADGWRKVANSAFPVNNGIELSRDGMSAFVASWSGASVMHLPLTGSRKPTEIKLPFHPDNIRWGDNGKLVATGHLATVEAVGACVRNNDSNCPLDYASAEIDPVTLNVTPLFQGTGTRNFGVATIGLRVDDVLWLGSVRSNCIATVNLTR